MIAVAMENKVIDEIDQKIVELLIADSRILQKELAARVGLSAPAGGQTSYRPADDQEHPGIRRMRQGHGRGLLYCTALYPFDGGT